MAELGRQGFTVKIHELFTDDAFARKNERGAARLYAATILLLRILSRLIFILRRSDVLIVHREAFPFFTPFLERLAVRRTALAVLDVDDAIHAHPTHIRDWRNVLRKPSKALEFSKIFDLILCGNESLMEAYGNAKAVTEYQPTCPPVSTFDIHHDAQTPISLLWTGSQSTLGSLKSVLPEILEVCQQENIDLYVLGGANVEELPPNPRLSVHRWSNAKEAEMLGTTSIGLMPLPDTEWERGKSGYKAILYLCAGMRAVVSPVGMNERLCSEFDVISRCQTGQWAEAIRRVVKDIRENGINPTSRTKARVHFDSERNARLAVKTMLGMLSNSTKHLP